MLPSSQIVIRDSLNTLSKGPSSMDSKMESDTPFEQVLEKEIAPARNCLGASSNTASDTPSAQSEGNPQGDEPGLKEITRLLKSLKKEVSKTGSAGAELVLSRPDEIKLTEFLQAFGLSKEQISKLKDQFLTGEEGEYRLDILFAIFSNQVATDAGKSAATITDAGEPMQDGIAPSDFAAVNAMLEEFGLQPNEVAALQSKLVSDGGKVDIKELVKQLKDLSGTSPRIIPLENWHEEQLHGLLARIGLSGEQIKTIESKAGLADQQFSMEKLASILESAAAVIDEQKNHVNMPEILHDLQHLLSKVEPKSGQTTNTETLRTWENKWLEQLQETWGKPVTPKPFSSGMSEEALVTEAVPIMRQLDTLPEQLLVQKTPLFMMMEKFSGISEFHTAGAKQTGQVAFNPEAFPQIMDRVMGSIRLREDRAVIKLFPPSLGEVRVKLVFKDDQLNTTFIIDNQKVKEIVEGGLSNLRTALLDQGIKLGECNVELNQDFSRFSGQEQRDAHPSKWTWNANGMETWSQPEQEMSIFATRGSPNARIDLFA